MLFRVLGYSKENAAKITIEIEAQSKADAERKAIRQNIEVTRVEIASEAEARQVNATLTRAPARHTGGSLVGKLLTMLLVATLVVALWYGWPTLMALIQKK